MSDNFMQRLQICVDRVGGPLEFSRRSGLSRTVLDKYRKGVSDPSRKRLIAMANAAGVSVAWLAAGEEKMTEQEQLKAAILDATFGRSLFIERIAKYEEREIKQFELIIKAAAMQIDTDSRVHIGYTPETHCPPGDPPTRGSGAKEPFRPVRRNPNHANEDFIFKIIIVIFGLAFIITTLRLMG